MRNLKVILSYNGAAYHGFQRQQNAITVQEVVENALSKLLGENSVIIGCSRTDSGVHAREFCFNTRTSSPIPCNGLVMGLNSLLPRDIAVHSCEDVAEGFHARYSAKSKEYAYLIHNGKTRDVFMRDLAYFHPHPLNLALMVQAAQLFVGEHDFSAYCKAESLEAVKSRKYGAVREVYAFDVEKRGDYIELKIKGNGFLHNMVRILSGTLLFVTDKPGSKSKLNLDNIRNSLLGGSRETAGVTLPPQGLYLNKVNYEQEQH
jgi:tRNA pseudouridine38-40 synthase